MCYPCAACIAQCPLPQKKTTPNDSTRSGTPKKTTHTKHVRCHLPLGPTCFCSLVCPTRQSGSVGVPARLPWHDAAQHKNSAGADFSLRRPRYAHELCINLYATVPSFSLVRCHTQLPLLGCFQCPIKCVFMCAPDPMPCALFGRPKLARDPDEPVVSLETSSCHCARWQRHTSVVGLLHRPYLSLSHTPRSLEDHPIPMRAHTYTGACAVLAHTIRRLNFAVCVVPLGLYNANSTELNLDC